MSGLILPPSHREQTLEVTTLHGMVVLRLAHPANEVLLSAQSAAEISRVLAMAAKDLAVKQGIMKKVDLDK